MCYHDLPRVTGGLYRGIAINAFRWLANLSRMRTIALLRFNRLHRGDFISAPCLIRHLKRTTSRGQTPEITGDPVRFLWCDPFLSAAEDHRVPLSAYCSLTGPVFVYYRLIPGILTH